MKRPRTPSSAFRQFWRHNGLSVVLAALFLFTWLVGQTMTGRAVYNDERAEHGQPSLSLGRYLRSAHFIEATAENWESEFFQMYVFVMITVFLYQKGSAESKDPSSPKREEESVKGNSPWPVRQGGWWLKIYSRSLSLALLLLFLVSFFLHAVGGHRLFNEEKALEGGSPLSLTEYLVTARFWFESFQNWQSEFLAILSMVGLTVVLREKGSPESKPVNMPHGENE